MLQKHIEPNCMVINLSFHNKKKEKKKYFVRINQILFQSPLFSHQILVIKANLESQLKHAVFKRSTSHCEILGSYLQQHHQHLIFRDNFHAEPQGRAQAKTIDRLSSPNSWSELTVSGVTEIAALLSFARQTRVIGGHTDICGVVWLLGRKFMIFLSFCGITGCGSASLKLCFSTAASPWSQRPSMDSQCSQNWLKKGFDEEKLTFLVQHNEPISLVKLA